VEAGKRGGARSPHLATLSWSTAVEHGRAACCWPEPATKTEAAARARGRRRRCAASRSNASSVRTCVRAYAVFAFASCGCERVLACVKCCGVFSEACGVHHKLCWGGGGSYSIRRPGRPGGRASAEKGGGGSYSKETLKIFASGGNFSFVFP